MEFSQITQLKASASDRPASGASTRSGNTVDASPFADAMSRAKGTQSSTGEPTTSPISQDPAARGQQQTSVKSGDSGVTQMTNGPATADSQTKTLPGTQGAGDLRSAPGQSRTSTLATLDTLQTATQTVKDTLQTTPETAIEALLSKASTLTDSRKTSLTQDDEFGAEDSPDALLALLSALPAFQPLSKDGANVNTGAGPGMAQGQAAAITGSGAGNLLLQAQAAPRATVADGSGRSLPADGQPFTDAGDDTQSRVPGLSLAGATANDPKAAIDPLAAGVSQNGSGNAATSTPSNAALAALHAASTTDRQPQGDGRTAFSLDAPDGNGMTIPGNPSATGTGAPGVTPTGTAAAGATIPVAVNSPQWPGAFGQQVLQLHQRGENRMELHLNPRDLGPVSVTLTVNDQQAQMQAVSAHAHVRAAVEAAIPQLREALAQSGIALGEATVGDQGQPREQSEQRDGGAKFAGGAGGNVGIGGEEPLGESPTRTVTLNDNGNISLYA
ncbi:flagellar hook-length control protein FliK [Salinicola aestuarinus]|uniref:flagellar hook-length control protein FliK n=1 Tax=Salinicola aestuarinus TaxID=1949082 RepID=UPI000DA24DD3|nr:flagellar hook-length control protein FliK [Salinicola aestuarinus]